MQADAQFEGAPMLSDALAAVLRNRRADFNARFEKARHVWPQLDGESLFEFVREAIDPVAVAVSAVDAAAVDAVVSVAYDAALTLVGQRLAGPAGRYPAITEGWKRVLPACARHLAQAPERVVAAVSNALHSLATAAASGAASAGGARPPTASDGARPAEWIGSMTRLAPDCPDVDSLLRAGQVAAWRAGLAHFREGALAIAANLPAHLASVALGAPIAPAAAEPVSGGSRDPSLAAASGTGAAATTERGRMDSPAGAVDSSSTQAASARDVAHILARLSQDIWFDPSAATQAQTLRLAREVGAFRGYGGLFKQPPQIAARDGGWLVNSADDVWFLTVDAFGATFHRATSDEWKAAKHDAQLPSAARLAGQTLKQGDESIALPVAGPVTSAATSRNTLALTSAHTHTILFVALGRA